MSDWIDNAIYVYGNYTIQGQISIENVTVFGELKVFGPINDKVFSKEQLLLNSEDQVVQGNIYIKNKFLEENRIAPVFIEDLHVKEINGRNVEKLYDNLIFPDGNNMDPIQHLNVLKPLKVNRIYTNGYKVFDIDFDKELEEYRSHGNSSMYEAKFGALEMVGSSLTNSLKKRPHYIDSVRQLKGIEGDFTDVIPVNFIEGAHNIATFDRANQNLSVQFYRFNNSEDEFVVDNVIPPLMSSSSGERILNVEKINLYSMDFLVLETQDGLSGEYVQTCLGFFTNEGFQRIWQMRSGHSIKITNVKLNNLDCLVKYSDENGTSEIACTGSNGLSPYQLLKGAPISQVVALKSEHDSTDSPALLVLTADGNIVMYKPDANHKLGLKQTLQIINPTYIGGICHEEYCYIAICSDKTENAVHYGSVEIYRARNGHDFTHFQTINIKIPVKVEFSLLPTKDMLLYVMTNNPTQSIIVYQYSGAAGFTEYISSSTIPKGRTINVVKLPEYGRELLAIITDIDVLFIEPVLKN